MNPESGSLRRDAGVVALLATFQSGGVGLNLAPAASAVVLLDVWWNPATEEQARDRVHRIGCVRECDVYSLRYAASFDTACRAIYHKYKSENSAALLMEDGSRAGEDVRIREGVTASLINEIATQLGVLKKAAPSGRTAAAQATTAAMAALFAAPGRGAVAARRFVKKAKPASPMNTAWSRFGYLSSAPSGAAAMIVAGGAVPPPSSKPDLDALAKKVGFSRSLAPPQERAVNLVETDDFA